MPATRLSAMLFVLFLLKFCVIVRAMDHNQTESRNAEFTIEDILLLNRQFLDFLFEYDRSQVLQPEDHRCVSTMQQLSSAYFNREQHGLEWFDSWGKIPSGMYHGNGNAFGNYDQCRQYNWQEVRGQHCTFLAAVSSNLPPLVSSLCVPHFCAPEFARQLYGEYLETRGVAVITAISQESLCIKDRDVVFDGGVVTAIVIFSIIAALVISSTTYELVQIQLKRDVVNLYSSFSLYSNLRSILHIVPKPKNVENKMNTIECAHGIRAISMIWIIVVHIHESISPVPVNNNPARMSYLSSFGSVVMFGMGYLAVDTFLALSGMLVAWNLLKELDKKGKINPLMLYLHRYIRITAPLAALILFVVSFAKYMGEGILWKTILDVSDETCSQYWWSALLHIQNYVNPRNMCLGWTWYLSVDMQLYIISPALIYPLWRYGKRVLIGIGLLALLSMGCVFTTFLVNDLRINQHAPNVETRSVLTYYPTHARMAVWLLGTIFGYILYKTKSTGVHLTKRHYAIGWSTCFALLGLMVYALYEFVRTDFNEFSNVADAFYEALHRSVFGICVMWIIFACVNGMGGLINEVLSSSLWQPLSKLSFTMYLLHVQLLLMASIAPVKTDGYFSVMDMFYRIWGAIGLTTSIAVLWSSIFEIPFVTLDKLLLRS
ncbi:nose resistant to fluoxetine protein 6-like [Topomyia yanbarensis]|uniref:nose resistant to fluoxetine protein 6-like n=1 Tax=Topomyia yanbarensis TaxID=2498891 RepID=UPI00273B9A89|nr:nose resistant to fluoxetine protein 6-like [Topomyia yanbarensis]